MLCYLIVFFKYRIIVDSSQSSVCTHGGARTLHREYPEGVKEQSMIPISIAEHTVYSGGDMVPEERFFASLYTEQN